MPPSSSAFRCPRPPRRPPCTAQCQITDPRLAELSGLVAVGDQLLAINDGGEQLAVHLLDAACQVVDVHTAAVDPYDPEDLAVGADGTVWLADTGDNNANRADGRAASRCGRTAPRASTG